MAKNRLGSIWQREPLTRHSLLKTEEGEADGGRVAGGRAGGGRGGGRGRDIKNKTMENIQHLDYISSDAAFLHQSVPSLSDSHTHAVYVRAFIQSRAFRGKTYVYTQKHSYIRAYIYMHIRGHNHRRINTHLRKLIARKTGYFILTLPTQFPFFIQNRPDVSTRCSAH